MGSFWDRWVRVKFHKITSVTGKERGDLEVKDYVVLEKTQEQADRLPKSENFAPYWTTYVHKTFIWYS
jgi:hypothetical protein